MSSSSLFIPPSSLSSIISSILSTKHVLPLWLRGHLPSTYDNFQIYEVSPDGNCFFSSLQIILASVGIYRTVEELRRVVADTVTVLDDSDTNETIKTWLELFKGASQENNVELMNEYRHMVHLKDTTWPLTLQDRFTLWKTMMTRNYWGEHHACRIIEEQTQMRLLIINGDLKKPSLVWYHNKKYSPTHYAIVYLTKQHYSPVSINNKFIFRWQEIPLEFQTFISQGY